MFLRGFCGAREGGGGRGGERREGRGGGGGAVLTAREKEKSPRLDGSTKYIVRTSMHSHSS